MGGAGPSTTDFLAIFILAGVVSIIFGRVCPPLALLPEPAGRAGTQLVLFPLFFFFSQNQNRTNSEANKSENIIQIQDASTGPEYTSL